MYFAFSPLEQFSISTIFSLNLTINNQILYLLIAASISPVLQYLGHVRGQKYSLIGNWWTIISHSLYRTILAIQEDNTVTKRHGVYFPLMYTLFYLILFSNFIGLIPYSSTPTVEFALTLSFALTLQIGLLIIGFLTHNVLLSAAFQPAGTPLPLTFQMIIIEQIAYTTRTLSQGLRQAVNMMTGHLQQKVVLGFIWAGFLSGTSLIILALPLLFLSVFLAQELLIAYQQAYIFVFIVCITFKDIV